MCILPIASIVACNRGFQSISKREIPRGKTSYFTKARNKKYT